MRSTWSKQGAMQNVGLCTQAEPTLVCFHAELSRCHGKQKQPGSSINLRTPATTSGEVHTQWIRWSFPGVIKCQGSQQEPWHGGHGLPAPSP